MDISLSVLSKLHLDVMISIDTIIFKQGVQHIYLVWFLPSKCKVLSREMESCYPLQVCIFYLKTYAPVITRFSHKERGAIPMGNETIFKKMLSYYPPLRKYIVCVFVSLSKISNQLYRVYIEQFNIHQFCLRKKYFSLNMHTNNINMKQTF